VKSENSKDTEKIIQDFYENFYDRTFNSDGIAGWAYRKTHKDLEKKVSQANINYILEIGAGSAQHLDYVRNNYSEYIMVDLNQQPHRFTDKRLKWIQGNIENAQFKQNYFDRSISMCVFHHLTNPAAVMKMIDFWLKPGGTFSLFLPTDPSFANRLNRKLFISPKTRKLGFENYEIVNAIEHQNHFWGIKKMLEHFFSDYEQKITYKPFGFNFPGLNLYTIWHLRKPEN
jgi:SAM-dependent methyltransferase